MIITMRQLKVLGICAGAGVCLYPFKLKPQAFKVIGNIEPRSVFHTQKDEQWEANFPGIPLFRDIPKKKPKKVDIIIGHPDCGDSSILRMSRAKKKGDVLGNRSINLFLESIKLYSPTYFLLENLPNFAKTYTNDVLSEQLNGEYELFYLQGPVSLWGNSQVSRKRLVIVGVNPQLVSRKVLKTLRKLTQGPYLKPPFPLKASEYFELGIQEQPELGHYREKPDKMCNLYLPERGLRQIPYSVAQQRWVELGPRAQRWPVGGKMKNQPGVTRNVVGKPPLTVRKQNRQFGTLGYVLSPREMANIQGVPLKFKLHVDLAKRVYWLNKNRVSVTKCMPMEIAKWFRNVILQAQNSK